MLKNQSILITGGTGSFGSYFVNSLLNKFPLIKKIIIFSRDELKQYNMRTSLITHKRFGKLRFFLGDVRDKSRLLTAFEDIDIIVHCAALKQVPAAEYNPIEFIKTNIIGAQNIIESALATKVKNVIALSTDKASSPINLYGATKLCSDKLFVSANNIKGNKNIKFSVVRYGNVMGSRGSVLHAFLDQKKSGSFNITDKRMTRFNITLDQSIEMVHWAIFNNLGGEIFVPKIPSFYIYDLAKVLSNNMPIKFTGIRPGEKLHEEMISEHDSRLTVDLKKYYAILNDYMYDKYVNKKNVKLVKDQFSYRSDNNPHFLNIRQLKEIVEAVKIF